MYILHRQAEGAENGTINRELSALKRMYHITGMRKEEILSLQRPHVDLREGKITLKAEDTKNGESRVIYMEGELLEAMRLQKTLKGIASIQNATLYSSERKENA
ncbi:MAG: tyrosine-type recombinase/integrase [Deltaproteobacteria bacterium]|nr:tyrosine-type recombinase/integrase [Deltaproteobacteria bacterium]